MSDNKITASNKASVSNAQDTSVLRNVTRLRRIAITPAASESATVIVSTLSLEIGVLQSPAKAQRRKGKRTFESLDAFESLGAFAPLREKSLFERLRM
jgi:hypothetical protein